MRSSSDFKWNKPIIFDSNFANAIMRLANEFINKSHEHILNSNNIALDEVRSYEDALRIYESKRDAKYLNIAQDLKKLYDYDWKVTLDNDIVLHSISTRDLIELPNAGNRVVTAVTFGNDSYSYSFEMTFKEDTWIGGTSITIRGPFEIVDAARSKIQDHLAAVTRPWWFLRDGKFLFGSWIAMVILANIGPIIVTRTTSDKNISSSFFFTIVLPIAVSAAYAIFPLILMSVKWWQWIFPMVDFQFGGGIARADIKNKIRNGLWAIPIISIILPIAANLITNKISK